MARISAKKREKAFRMRLQQHSFADISREIGVSTKTISRWEKGWVDAKGRSHTGWKAELEKAWKEKSEADLSYGLIVKEERIRTYEELARMAVNKIKDRNFRGSEFKWAEVVSFIVKMKLDGKITFLMISSGLDFSHYIPSALVDSSVKSLIGIKRKDAFFSHSSYGRIDIL